MGSRSCSPVPLSQREQGQVHNLWVHLHSSLRDGVPQLQICSWQGSPPAFVLNLEEIAMRSHPAEAPAQEGKEKKPKKEKEEKPAQEKKPKKEEAPEDPLALFGRAHLQVSRLFEVQKHPSADKLLVAKCDVGQGEVRTLVAGLALHYQPAELEGRLVCTVTNLKPAKLVGVESQAMLFAATDPATQRVATLVPPEGSQPGDRITVEGVAPAEGLAIVQKKHWDKVVEGFVIQANQAHFHEHILRTARGVVTCPGVADGSTFH
eukprot:GAFH01003603.1.p1 GENE.GAFH01003603.1~~GAFH01003603.1.p1  ORF type:complete len:263 (-),score=74.80 GAFH01003603.1:25-813(-)